MPYQVMNLPNAYGIANPQQWIIEKRPDHMLAPPFTLPGWPRMGLGTYRPNAWGISNPVNYIVEERPEVTWMPWFAPGGSMGGSRLSQGDTAAVFENQIRSLLESTRNLPNADDFINDANFCFSQAAVLRSSSNAAEIAKFTADVKKCVDQLRTRVDAAIAAATAGAPPAPAPSKGPAIAVIAASIALVGLSALVASQV